MKAWEVHPLLVTRDDIGGCWGLSRYLQILADKLYNRRTLRPKTITPIFCMSSEGIEALSGYLRCKLMTDLLEGWYKNDRGLNWSFQAIYNSTTRSVGLKSNTDLNNAFQAVFQNAADVLFPGAKLNPPDTNSAS